MSHTIGWTIRGERSTNLIIGCERIVRGQLIEVASQEGFVMSRRWKGSVRLRLGIAILAATAILVAIAIYSWSTAEPTLETMTVDDYPITDGSSSTHPVGVITACHLLDIPYRDIHWPDGSIRPWPDWEAKEYEEEIEKLAEKIGHHGTHGSYVSLIEGRSDLILVARLPSDEELDYAKKEGVEYDIRPFALDAFVFVVNRNCSIKDLTLDEIRGIYTGDITNWTELGGIEANITAYQRDDQSGSQQLMRRFVMGDLEMMDMPDWILWSMMGPINMLDQDKNGLGYSVYYFEQFMAPNDNLSLCAIEGVLPTAETIASGEYPLTTEVYVVIRKDQESDSLPYALRDWYLSKEGQNLVRECGYVPMDDKVYTYTI